MQNITRETITIEAFGKYGPKANGGYFNWSQKSGLSDASVKIGGTYDVLVYQSPGKKTRYINQIVGETPTANPTPVVEAAPARIMEAPTKEVSSTKAKSDDKEAYWAAKNDSQKLGGLFHDAAQITAAIAMSGGYDVAKALTAFEEVLNGVIKVRSKLD